MIVAWRVYFLTKQGRETPDWPCTELLEEAEWKALTAYIDNNGSPADHPPTLVDICPDLLKARRDNNHLA